MKPLAALAALLVALAGTAVPAFARDSFVIDNAHLLSAATIAQINAKVADFNAQTKKEVVVDTEPAVTGGTAQQMAENIYAQQQINGVLIFIAQSPKTIGVLPGRSESAFFPSGSTAAIRQAIANGFNAGDFNGGVNNGVDLTLSIYRSHLGSLRPTTMTAPVAVPVERAQAVGGPNITMIIFWLIALAVIFFIVRGIFRAMSGPRMMGPPMGGPMGGPGGYPPGYGGYGPGYGGPGMGGGGGSFFSGLLGGLGGAFLGNELFGNRGGTETIVQQDPGSNFAGMGPGGVAPDASGWQNDAGQADPGNASFGGWGGGDSGGSSWGGGDSGGGWGGGGDSGGGWGGGDSGGGDSGGGGW